MDKFRILTNHCIGRPRNGRYEKLTVRVERFARQLHALRIMCYELSDLADVSSWLAGAGKSVNDRL